MQTVLGKRSARNEYIAKGHDGTGLRSTRFAQPRRACCPWPSRRAHLPDSLFLPAPAERTILALNEAACNDDLSQALYTTAFSFASPPINPILSPPRSGSSSPFRRRSPSRLSSAGSPGRPPAANSRPRRRRRSRSHRRKSDANFAGDGAMGDYAMPIIREIADRLRASARVCGSCGLPASADRAWSSSAPRSPAGRITGRANASIGCGPRSGQV